MSKVIRELEPLQHLQIFIMAKKSELYSVEDPIQIIIVANFHTFCDLTLTGASGIQEEDMGILELTMPASSS